MRADAAGAEPSSYRKACGTGHDAIRLMAREHFEREKFRASLTLLHSIS
jgi:hypothetical protein